MNYGELTKLLKEAGWYHARDCKGSHKIWRHEGVEAPIIIPDHGNKEIAPSLLKGILKQAGLK